MIIKLANYAAGSTVLAGKAAGRHLLTSLLADVQEPMGPTVAFLDFWEIEVATGSFLREGPLAFRDVMRSRNSRLYPVFANCTTAIVDDLRQLLEDKGDAALVCEVDASETSKNTILVGNLDEKQLLTFQLLQQHGEVDAAALAQISGESVGLTAWNNRLAALAAKGIIIERNVGRLKRFRLSA